MAASNRSRKQVDAADAEDMNIDTSLLEACRSGQRDAQQRVYERCHRQVFRLMVRMVGVQDAPDLTQQIFLQMFRKLEQFAGHSRFQTWLYRIAVNEALQHQRKRHRWSFQALPGDPLSHRQPESVAADHRELLEQALARVDPELRAVFLLREQEGLSYHEIAETVGIPEGTVGSRLNRVRRELQQHLVDLGWEA